MIRTLMFVSNLYPHDPRVRKEANALTALGYSVTVIAFHDKSQPYYEEIDGVRIYRIPDLVLFKKVNNRSKNVIARIWTKAKTVIGYGFEYFYFTFATLILSLYILVRRGFDVVHMHNPPDTLSIVGIIYKVLRKKYVFDHHDISPELYLTRVSGKKDIAYSVLISMEKLSCKCSDIVISTNESYKRIVMDRHHIGAEKIHIVRNNPKIDDCNMESSGLKGDDADKKEILFIGAINPQDGVHELLKVMVHLVYVLKETNVICNIVGGGDSLDSAKKFAEEMQLSQYVHFAGVIHDRNTVKKYLNRSLIGVEPAPLNAANEHSTFIKVMEYMASRTPVVAFDLKETRYSADGGAILVEPGDIPAFANAIQKLLHDKELRTQMGNRGFQRVQEELNWQKSIDNLSTAYQALVR